MTKIFPDQAMNWLFSQQFLSKREQIIHARKRYADLCGVKQQKNENDIKKFIENLVVPNIEDEYEKNESYIISEDGTYLTIEANLFEINGDYATASLFESKELIVYDTKEFKELPYGFGAATGYSMITDGMKTIDDAINEATLEMRTDKEDYK